MNTFSEICEPIAPNQHVVLDSCTFSGQKVNCSDPLDAGSTAIAKCEKGYRGGASKSNVNVYCAEDGSWNNLPFCIEGKMGVMN